MIAGPKMVKHKSYTLINLVSLAFGICACIVIFLVTDYKLSFDNSHSDGDSRYHNPVTIEPIGGLITHGGNTIPNVNELLNEFDDNNLCKSSTIHYRDFH